MLAQFHLKVAFGDSSDDEHLADRETSVVGDSTKAVWERVGKINGLWFCRNFLSVHHQSDLLSAILDSTPLSYYFKEKMPMDLTYKGWFVQESINQAMRFGDLPSWATELSDLILESVESVYLPVLPADLLWREPLCSTSSFSIYTNQDIAIAPYETSEDEIFAYMIRSNMKSNHEVYAILKGKDLIQFESLDMVVIHEVLLWEQENNESNGQEKEQCRSTRCLVAKRPGVLAGEATATKVTD
ncbi:hypothetical protein Bca52824_010828 [Brassica carinata]|uniref:Uncharacterized protein n=1 Tax=Brassica carinata TaxID=52824 RepID=A0A8X7WF57_BRACI|nr:hypothetical protein Bca52824_010828 [Brassica carinata]